MLDGDEAAGQAIVLAADPADAPLPLPPGTAVLLARGSDRDWARRRAAGDTVRWHIRVLVDGHATVTDRAAGNASGGGPRLATDDALTEAVGGFPQLLRGGRPVLDEQTISASFGASRHPRTAVGWTPDRRLLLVVVDGRQPDWSLGMSLAELTWLFQRLGASHAMNLDGGGSTAMVVAGAVVNRPSDRGGERAVGNALVLAGCR
jgi:exopolysaccharide biosynthesis protein